MALEVKRKQYGVKTANVVLDVKNVDTNSRTVTGILNTYNMVDSDGDILLPGCAAKSIKERGPLSKAIAKIKFCKNHDMCQMPGKFTLLEEREIGGKQVLYFEAKMSNAQLGTDTLAEYVDGVIDNHSIGFNYVWEKVKAIEINTPEWEDMLTWLINPKDLAGRSVVYIVKEIKLWEGSAVAFGANMATPFLGMAKSRTKESVSLMLDSKLSKLEQGLDESVKGLMSAKSEVGEQTPDEVAADIMYSFKGQLSQFRQLLDDLKEYIVVPDPKQDLKPEIEKGIDYSKVLANLEPKPLDYDKIIGAL